MLKDCVWDGPDFLLETTILSQYYGRCKGLFCRILCLQNASLAHFVREAQSLKCTDQVSYIRNIFLGLESCIDRADAPNEVRLLRQMPIWPIRSKDSSHEYDYLGVGDETEVTWFIADRTHFETAFKSKVDLLAFGVDDITRMEKLLQAVLETSSRLLTTVAKSFASTSAHLTPQGSFSRSLQRKAGFILR
jgi:hypothetical protein